MIWIFHVITFAIFIKPQYRSLKTLHIYYKYEMVTSVCLWLLMFLGLENEIDIMGTVLHMRNQRFGMVQTEVREQWLVDSSHHSNIHGYHSNIHGYHSNIHGYQHLSYYYRSNTSSSTTPSWRLFRRSKMNWYHLTKDGRGWLECCNLFYCAHIISYSYNHTLILIMLW